MTGHGTTWGEYTGDAHAFIFLDTAGKGFTRDINNKIHRSWIDLMLYLWRDFRDPSILRKGIGIDQAKELYKIGDQVDLCLKFIPVECRKVRQDPRGEIYSIKNLRTKETYYGHYGKNNCGGA